jgi:predicted metal-dependent phosphotriesterase family hydrolase
MAAWTASAPFETMRAHGFTDKELDLMFKENPTKALGLTTTTVSSGQ